MPQKKRKQIKYSVPIRHLRKSPKLRKEHSSNSPEYMVQISDPKMLRKDVLENLREIIVFMQGYEKFRAVQQEKVSIFAELKSHINGLADLNNKLKRYFPKGNMPAITKKENLVLLEEEEETVKEERKVIAEPKEKKNKELDELENQLKDIEKQLQKIE